MGTYKHLLTILTAGAFALVLTGGTTGLAADEKPTAKTEAPEKVYRKYYQAKQRLDTWAITELTSKRSKLKKDGLYERLMRERSALPDQIEFIAKKSDERVAQALFKGSRRDRETGKMVTSRGTIQFLKEGGAWRLYREKWEDIKAEDYVPFSLDHDRHLPPLVPKESSLPPPQKTPAKQNQKRPDTE